MLPTLPTYFYSLICIFLDDEEEDDDEIDIECKHCGDFYVPDQRLPDWMSRASCHKCLVWSCSNNPGESSSTSPMMSKLKKQVVLCQFCRQGKFGWTKSCKSKSISICVNCADRSEAYLKMTLGSQVENYLIGMLNQLVSQSISPTNN